MAMTFLSLSSMATTTQTKAPLSLLLICHSKHFLIWKLKHKFRYTTFVSVTNVTIFLPVRFGICFGRSKEPSYIGVSFEYPQLMFWLRNSRYLFSTCSLVKGLWTPLQVLMPWNGFHQMPWHKMLHRKPSGQPRGYKTWVHSQTQNKAKWLARVRKQPVIALYFESETVLGFYKLEAWSQLVGSLQPGNHQVSISFQWNI